MMAAPSSHAPLQNHLLSSLSRQDYERILPRLKLIDLPPGEVLYEMDDTFRHACCPLSGILSLLSITEAGGTIEVAMRGLQPQT